MKKLLFLIFILVNVVSYSQVTRYKIKSFLKKDRYNNTSSIITCNSDSIFFKIDTIRFYKDRYRKNDSCCEFVEWKFYNKLHFHQVRSQMCKEPPSASVYTIADDYILKIEKNEKGFLLNTYQKNKIVKSYLVLSLNPIYDEKFKDFYDELVLVKMQLPN